MDRYARPAAFGAICVAWSSTWLVIKVGYGGLSPFNVAAIRFLIAGTGLVLAAAVLRIAPPDGRAWALVAWMGLAWFSVAYGLVYWAELHLSSGATAALYASMPIFTAGAATVLLPTERVGPRQVISALIGVAGIAVMFSDQFLLGGTATVAAVAVVASSALAATSSVLVKRYGGCTHPVALNGYAMLLGGVIHGAAAFAENGSFAFPTDVGTWAAILYLSAIGTVMAFVLYTWLLRTWSATSLSFVTIVTPVLALALGVVVLREVVTVRMGLGTGLVLAAVRLVSTVQPRRTTAQLPQPASDARAVHGPGSADITSSAAM